MGSTSRDIFGLNYSSSSCSSSSSSANANNQFDHHPGLFTPGSVTSGNVSPIGSITCPNFGACFQPRNPPHGSSTLPPPAQSSFASFSSDHSSALLSNPNSIIGSNSSVTSLGSWTSSGHSSFSPFSSGPIYTMTSSNTAATSTFHGSNSQSSDFPILCQLFNGLDLDHFGAGFSTEKKRKIVNVKHRRRRRRW